MSDCTVSPASNIHPLLEYSMTSYDGGSDAEACQSGPNRSKFASSYITKGLNNVITTNIYFSKSYTCYNNHVDT